MSEGTFTSIDTRDTEADVGNREQNDDCALKADSLREDGLYLYQAGTSLLNPDHPYFIETGARPSCNGSATIGGPVAEDGTTAVHSDIGDRMQDGTIYSGVSPDTGKRMYTTPADGPLTYAFNEAQRYALGLNEQHAHDHDDWRVPTKGELNLLYNNRAAIGGFDESGSNPTGWYWSSSEYSDGSVWAQRFSDGSQGWSGKLHASSLRCVR